MREKLIELLGATGDCNARYCDECVFHKDEEGCIRRQKEIIADYLIANGVTVTDNNVGGKCDYCHEDAEGYRKMIGAFSITNPFHGSTWQIETAHCKPRQIYFCPMCGRKLAEPPKGE